MISVQPQPVKRMKVPDPYKGKGFFDKGTKQVLKVFKKKYGRQTQISLEIPQTSPSWTCSYAFFKTE
eukprot:gene30740-37997_t